MCPAIVAIRATRRGPIRDRLRRRGEVEEGAIRVLRRRRSAVRLERIRFRAQGHRREGEAGRHRMTRVHRRRRRDAETLTAYRGLARRRAKEAGGTATVMLQSRGLRHRSVQTDANGHSQTRVLRHPNGVARSLARPRHHHAKVSVHRAIAATLLSRRPRLRDVRLRRGGGGTPAAPRHHALVVHRPRRVRSLMLRRRPMAPGARLGRLHLRRPRQCRRRLRRILATFTRAGEG